MIGTQALCGDPVDNDKLLAVLASVDDDLLDVIAAGFVIEGIEQSTPPVDRHDLVITRHRGAGTTISANI